MATQNSLNRDNDNTNNTTNTTQGSGSEYHREHASNIPDYGGNSVDPNAKELSNRTDVTK